MLLLPHTRTQNQGGSMRTIQILIAFILVCASFFGLAFTSHASGAKAGGVTDAEFTDVIMNVGSDETERNLTWYSNYKTTGEVQYAQYTGGSFPSVFSTVPARVADTNEEGYYSYKATLTGLEANTTYVYRLVTGNTYSNTRTFKVNEFGDEFSFVYLADPQTGGISYKVKWESMLESINTNFPTASFIVSGGDQIATATSEENYEYFIVDGTSKIAIAPSNGPAHDNSVLYRDHYNLPNLSSEYAVTPATADYYYTYNNVLFVHFNVESKDAGAHIEFLERAIANNPDALWTVVVMHFSLYSGGSENHSALGNALVSRMNELGVDVVLSGHDHYYVRSELMTSYDVESGDTVINNTVTDPKGTLFVCADTATGEGTYSQSKDHHTALYVPNPSRRLNAMIFEVSETSLSFKSYYLDGETPEVFDHFTINRTAPKVRVSNMDMIEILVGEERKSIVNAYDYSTATLKVVNGYWSVSTNGGASYSSLGIAATDASENDMILSIGRDGYWQYSTDGGASYEKLGVNVNYYTVIYKTDTNVAPGAPDARYYYLEGQLPDPPALTLPTGSFDAGVFYKWYYEYTDHKGNPTDTFKAGETYTAQLVYETTDILTELTISRTPNEAAGIYTWDRAWEIAFGFPSKEFTFKLAEDMTLTSAEARNENSPHGRITQVSHVIIDLAGHTLDTTASNDFLVYYTGSTGSSINVITSEPGGTLLTQTFIYPYSDNFATLDVGFGSDDGYPLTVNCAAGNGGYLVCVGGNFKRSATLTLTVKNGKYTMAKGLVYLNNVNSEFSTANHYKIDVSNADITVGAEIIKINADRPASASSYLNATDSTFTSKNTVQLVDRTIWYGNFTFENCKFDGIAFDKTFDLSDTKNTGIATFGDGCTFKNYGASFNNEYNAFVNDRLKIKFPFVLNIGGDGESLVIGRKAPDGRELLLRINAGFIQWQYAGDEEWNDFVELSTLIGDGGYEPELRINEATDNWEISYDEGKSWTSLGIKATVEVEVEKPVITPITPILRVNEETDEWEASYDNGESWTTLGIKATVDGEITPAPTPTLRANETTNMWEVSYDNGESWKSLGIEVKVEVEVEVEVEKPITPILRVNEETGEWEASYDEGKTWTSLGVKADIDDDDDKNTDNGEEDNDVENEPEPAPVKKSFFQRILDFFRKLFGIKKKED